MKLAKENLRLLGLSRKEIKILDVLRAGYFTPLLISEQTKVSRPAIYEILARLRERGLVKSNIRNGKKYWSQTNERDLERELYGVKRQLFDIKEGVEEVRGLSDSTVIIHRGAEAIRKLLKGIIKINKSARLYGIQGDATNIGWSKIFGAEETNELNRLIKQNEIIAEEIIPYGWLERQARLFGKKWAEDFEGRAAVTHEIGEEYFQHGGQMWLFKDSLYFIAMNEEIVIEVRNAEIQKLVLSMFRFIQDNSRKIDINALLRKLIAQKAS